MATWSREIKKLPTKISKAENFQTDDLRSWMEKKARDHKLKWLLVHADDGVIWGRFEDATYALSTSEKVASERPEAKTTICVELRLETIQQARLFGKYAEVLIFRENKHQWRFRIIENPEGSTGPDSAECIDCYDEPYLLLGTHGIKLQNHFTLLSDGAQGLRHAVPIDLVLGEQGRTDPPHLVVRHFLNQHGVAKVVVSRLVDLIL